MQHREVQGHESSLFSSYFSAGIRYLDGGVASGFRKVSDEQYEKKLLQIKGKRNVRVIQVSMLSNHIKCPSTDKIVSL